MTAERTGHQYQANSWIKWHELRIGDMDMLDPHLWEYPFPYTPETFSPEEAAVLKKFFTNTDQPVFAVKNLPQEVVGAMFSRYSRSDKSVRRLFLEEFWGSKDLAIQNIADYLSEEEGEELETARRRARNFYRVVLAEFGDDSVIQMGSVHIAFEFVSQVAAKAIEDGRIAASYIEKSTRYVDFGTLIGDRYLYMDEPRIARSEYAAEYGAWNRTLFEIYKQHIPATIELIRRKYPIEDQVFVDRKTGREYGFVDIPDERNRNIVTRAYERALKAKALDTIRVFLPTTTVTNLGAHFSGQAAERIVNKLMSSGHPEVQIVGILAYQEMAKVIPNFLLNLEGLRGEQARTYLRGMDKLSREVVAKYLDEIEEPEDTKNVKLVDWDKDADVLIASQIIFKHQGQRGLSKQAILAWAKNKKAAELKVDPEYAFNPTLVGIIFGSTPDRSDTQYNRRHKLSRAFEHSFAEVDYYADFGIFRDLQRNRMSTTERQELSADEVFIPAEFREPGMEQVLCDYITLAAWTKDLHHRIANSPNDKLKGAAEYVTILGNKLRFNVRANLRQWCFFSELRTIPGGHPTYRNVMQETVRQMQQAITFLEPLFANVDWVENYGLGRLTAELKTEERLADAKAQKL